MLKNNTVSKLLSDRRIAIFATDGFDETQLFSPKKALENAGADVVIVSLNQGEIKSWDKDHWGKSIHVDMTIENSSSRDFDALIIPGGKLNPENLCHDKRTVNFVKDFVNDGKLVASSCDGTQILIKLGLTKGRTLTTKSSLKKDLINSGAKWKDEEVVSYKGIVSSRSHYDNPTFNQKIIEGVSIGPHLEKINILSQI